MLVIAFAALAAGAIGVTVWYFTSARRWHAEPDRAAVDAAWKVVEEAAVFDPETTGDVALWGRVAAASSKASTAVDAASKRNASDWADLEPVIVDATDALVAWSEGRGALVAERCATPERWFPVFKMVKVGLGAVRAPPARFVTAVQRLARLSRRAASIVAFMGGLGLTDSLRAWAIRERFAPDDAFRALRPLVAEKHAALARGAICHDQLYDALRGDAPESSNEAAERIFGKPLPSDAPGVATGPGAPPWHARHFVDAGRERRMMRLFLGGFLQRCAARRDDAAAHDACMEADADRLPPSIGVRVAAFPAPAIAKYVVAYDAFLAGH